MTFIRCAFLLNVLMSLNVFAQTQLQTSEQNNKPQAYKFDEFVKITKAEVQKRFDKFDYKLSETDDWASGIVVFYTPTEKELVLRENIILKNWRRQCRYDMPEVTFIRVYSEKEKTELWIVPKGAESPTFEKK